MSILNCNTRLTFVNCTGLEIHVKLCPTDSTTSMRVQPLDAAHMRGAIESKASNIGSWFQEWLQLVTYGPTHSHVEWTLPASATESARFNIDAPFHVEMRWSDPSVSWAEMKSGIWSLDISNTNELTIYVKSDLGSYNKKRMSNGPSTVQSVQLKLDLEIACEDELPFSMMQMPVANMYWRRDINLQKIVNPSPENHNE